MKKTDNFFLIHNFNTVPEELLAYCRDYLIVDASSDTAVTNEIASKGLKHVHVENTGHNITTYFSYFDRFHSELPEVMALLKGNIIDRHLSKEYFERVYDNKSFTYLYEEKAGRPRYVKKMNHGEPLDEKNAESIAFLATESHYAELNSSWYVGSPEHPNRYFDNLDDMLSFVFEDPVIPKYVIFSPGACYIVRREQITKYPREFYRNMNKLMNYGLDPSFPSEAHMVERILPMIFEESLKVNPWMVDEKLFDEKLVELAKALQEKVEGQKQRNASMSRRVLSRIKKVLVR